MGSLGFMSMVALATISAISSGTTASGQSCSPGSTPTVTTVSHQLGPIPPPWIGLPIGVPQFNASAGQVLVQADITLTVLVSGSTQAENLSSSGACVWSWCLGSSFHLNVPVPSQPPLTLSNQFCGVNPLAPFDGTLDYGGTSGATNQIAGTPSQTSVSITNPSVLASVFTGSGTVPFTSDAVDTTTHTGCANLTAIFVNRDTVTISVEYTYCSPGLDFCVPGLLGVLACPCSNPQSPAASSKGCNNSAATGGARLQSGGAATLAADSVVFTSVGETSNATTIFLQGDASIAGGAVFGQGVRCTGGTLLRLYVKTASSGAASAPVGTDPSISARSTALGHSIVAGTSRYYNAYYRDSTVLGGCPASSTFNTTQGQSVLWAP